MQVAYFRQIVYYLIFFFIAEPMKDADLIQSDISCEMQEKCIVPPSMAPISGVYDYKYRYSVAESSPGYIHNSSILNHSSPAMRRRPPSPPKRQSSHSSDLQNSIGKGKIFQMGKNRFGVKFWL